MGTVGPAHARAGADAPALGLVRWGGRGAGVVGTHGPERPCGLREDEPYRLHAMVRLIMDRPEARFSPKGRVRDYWQEIDYICVKKNIDIFISLSYRTFPSAT